ncbi:MAG: hypothetical protein ACYSWU_28815, partial [Planctomycetota bacterium]
LKLAGVFHIALVGCLPGLVLGACGSGSDSAGHDAGAGRDTGPVPFPDADVNTERQTFAQRCAHPDVVACWPFDTAAETDPYLHDSGHSAPVFDDVTPAEGGGSIHMQVLSGSAADTSGSAVLDFPVAFGPGEPLYIQWRQRFSADFLETEFDANGWKQLLVHENTSTAGCSDSGMVGTNSYNRGYPIVYHACNIFHSLVENPVDGDQWEHDLQPGGDNRCLYSWIHTDGLDFLEPTDDVDELACVGHLPDQWVTYQLGVHLTAWCTESNYEDCAEDSQIALWVTWQGQPPIRVIDWPLALRATTDPAQTAYDSVQLTPYNTNKNSSQNHPPGDVWYDSVIVSRSRIAEPAP